FVKLLFSFFLLFLLLPGEFAHRCLVSFYSQVVLQQEVVRVAVRHVFDVAFFTYVFYVFQENHFHSSDPPPSFSVNAAFNCPTASSMLASGICVAAFVKWPPPPRFSMMTCTLTSPSQRALIPKP